MFAEVVARFAGLVERGAAATPDRLPMLLEGTAPEPLLGRFLEDLLYLAHEERFAATRLERLVIDGGELRAAVSGWTGPVAPLVSTVTGSHLRHDDTLGCWQAVVRLR